MDPDVYSDVPEITPDDTGQNARNSSPSATEEGFIDHDGVQESLVCCDMKLNDSSMTSPLIHSGTSPSQSMSSHDLMEHNSTLENTETQEKGAVKSETSDDCSTKVTILLQEDEIKDDVSPNSAEEDLDPLLAVDDTESQSSDLINFDTVSYDVIHQQGVDGDYDDDERSIATMSSLSCDIKLDSQKLSQTSNGSSLMNLLDASLKESSSLERCSSAQLLVGGTSSAASSCPSSPLLGSSKINSLAVEGSTSDAFQHILQANEDNAEDADVPHEILRQEIIQCEVLDSTLVMDAVAPESKIEVLNRNELLPAPVNTFVSGYDATVPVSPNSVDFIDITSGGTGSLKDCIEVQNADVEHNENNAHSMPAFNATIGQKSPCQENETHLEEDCRQYNSTSSRLASVKNLCQEPSLEFLEVKTDFSSSVNRCEESSQLPPTYDAEKLTQPTSENVGVTLPQDLNVESPVETPCCSTTSHFQLNQENLHDEDSKCETSSVLKDSDMPFVSETDLNMEDSDTPFVGETDLNILSEDAHAASITPSLATEGNILATCAKSCSDVSSVVLPAVTQDNICSLNLGSVQHDSLANASVVSSRGIEGTVASIKEVSDPPPPASSLSGNLCVFSVSECDSALGSVAQSSSEEDTSVLPLLPIEENVLSTSGNITKIPRLPNECETSDASQIIRNISPVDSALSVSDFVTSEESVHLKSSGSLYDSTEISSTDAISILSSPSGALLAGQQLSCADAVVVPTINPDYPLKQSVENSLDPTSQSVLYSNLMDSDSDGIKNPPSILSDFRPDEIDVKSIECSQKTSDTALCEFGSSSIEYEDNKKDEDEHLLKISEKLKDLLLFTEQSCHCGEDGSCNLHLSPEEECINNVEKRQLESKDKLSDSCSYSSTPTSPGLCSNAKQYTVAALDEAQQIASCLVDEILQTAVLEAEKQLMVSKNEDAINLANFIVNEAISASAHALTGNAPKVEILASCSAIDAKKHPSPTLTNPPTVGETGKQGMNEEPGKQDMDEKTGQQDKNEEIVNQDISDKTGKQDINKEAVNTITSEETVKPDVSEETVNQNFSEETVKPDVSSGTSSLQNQVLPSNSCSDLGTVQLPPLKCDTEKETSMPLSESYNKEILMDLGFDMDPNSSIQHSVEVVSDFGENSDSDAGESQRGEVSTMTFTSSPEDDAVDSRTSSKSSLVTNSDLGVHMEASLFVDGILESAVKKYEESSSSETSPVKLRGLALDTEWEQDEEELATPCGEMLAEHFMDFESGRNVSVFCSIPERSTDDHLLAYDRIVNTIGNREVDSDTGKSVSVFRSEEEVFYEIQRASACTSVFESVEEEDEDMVDMTVPLEDQSDILSQESLTSPSSEGNNVSTADEKYNKDCDAFEDAVDAFLSKERLARDEDKINLDSQTESACSLPEKEIDGSENPSHKSLSLKHPEYDLSNQEEKRRMAEKWAKGGEFEVPDTPEMRQKQKAIREALDSEGDIAAKLCKLALTEGGLINDALRREAWPRMLGLDPSLEIDAPSLEDLKSHPEYGQVVLDVNRSLKRFPPDIPTDQRETLQDKLTRLIMYVISKHPHLRYYQGYHDVAVTFLLVVGESIAFQIMERLSTEHLSDCMQPTMERTSYLLHFIYPLLHRLHPTLADYLEKSEVGTMFCLPWFLTWFGHSLDRYQDVVRLYDHFLASPPLAPLYVAAVLVAHRADEVLAVDCDMAAIHALLSHIPDSLPLEILLHDATDLYERFPPESIEREVEERFRNEQEVRVHEMEARERIQRQHALRRRRGNSQDSGSWQLAEFQDRVGPAMMVVNRWIPPWVVQQQRLSMRLLFASATFFVGFYVYSRGGDMLPYP